MEAVYANSMLTQILGEHRRIGNDDPRVTTRSQLLEMGVPLRCAPKSAPPQQCSSFFKFLQRENTTRKKNDIRLTAVAYKEWEQTVFKKWTGMSDLARSAYQTEVQADYVTKLADLNGDDTVDDGHSVRDTGIYENVVTKCGSKKEPFESEWFEMSAKQLADIDLDEPLGGFTAYDKAMRAHLHDKVFVQDKGDIPPEEQYEYSLPCGAAHPGLCAEVNADIMPRVHEAVKEFRSFTSKLPKGTPLCVWAASGGVPTPFSFVLLSRFRGSNPRFALLTQGVMNNDCVLRLPLDQSTKEYGHIMDISLLGHVFTLARGDGVSMYCARLRQDKSVFFQTGSHIMIDRSDFRAATADAHQIFPPVPGAARQRKSDVEKKLEADMRRLPGAKATSAEQLEKERRVKIAMPKPAGAPLGDAHFDEDGSASDLDLPTSGCEAEAVPEDYEEESDEEELARAGAEAARVARDGRLRHDLSDDVFRFRNLVGKGLSLQCPSCGVCKDLHFLASGMREKVAVDRLSRWAMDCPLTRLVAAPPADMLHRYQAEHRKAAGMLCRNYEDEIGEAGLE